MSAKLRSMLAVALRGSSLLGRRTTGCPKPSSPPEARAIWEAELDAKRVLALDPRGKIAIKRDVHDFIVSVDARTFADAFHGVLVDPERRFGLIEINRKRASLGEPFALGERFQGRYSLAGALRGELGESVGRLLDDLVKDPRFATIVCDIENKHLSDYGIISDLDLTPQDGKVFSFAYRYLTGSPIAGSSTFIVTQLEPGKSRVTQIFEYQEQSRSFATFFATQGIQLHNRVVRSQVEQSVEVAGGKILESN